MAIELDITLTQGKTFELALMYASDERVYVPIAGVPSLAPVRLMLPGHGMPDGWPFDIACVNRPSELNGRDYVAKVIDDDTVEINSLLGDCWRPWAGGGIVAYQKPEDIAGWRARSVWRRSVNSTDSVLTFHSDAGEAADGLVIIDPITSTFTLRLDAQIAEGLPVIAGVFDVEAIDPQGRVFPLTAVSRFEIGPEVTR